MNHKQRRKKELSSASRRRAMQAIVGIRSERTDLPDAEKYIRRLRKGRRPRQIAQK